MMLFCRYYYHLLYLSVAVSVITIEGRGHLNLTCLMCTYDIRFNVGCLIGFYEAWDFVRWIFNEKQKMQNENIELAMQLSNVTINLIQQWRKFVMCTLKAFHETCEENDIIAFSLSQASSRVWH